MTKASGARRSGWVAMAIVLCLSTLPANGRVLFAAGPAGPAGSAGSTDYIVTKIADTNDGVCDADCSLREAIIAANAHAGADRVVLGAGLVYHLTIAPAVPPTAGDGDLNVTDDLTIDGNGSTIDAGGIDRVLNIQGGAFTVTINGLTITHGAASGFPALGGGILVRNAALILNGVTVSANTAAHDGGGIAAMGSYNAATATTTLASLTLNHTAVSGNTGSNGGGIVCVLCAFTTSSSTVASNSAAGDGGGLDVLGNSSTASMNSSSILSNTAARGGGLSAPFGASTSTLSRNRIVSNAGASGSALFNNIGTVTAANNWWGCNYGPGAGGAGCAAAPNGVSGAGTTAPYLVLKTSAAPPGIFVNASTTVTADLTFNSASADTSAGGTLPNGVLTTFSDAASLGTFASPTAMITGGKSTDVYTSGATPGTAALGATIDGQTVSTTVPIAALGPQIVVEQPPGTGIPSGGSAAFGSVPDGTGSSSLSFTIRNAGVANLTGLGITIDGADPLMFAVTSPPTAPVLPGGSTAFTVQFTPTNAGPRSAALHIASNDPLTNPFNISLGGSGINSPPTITAISSQTTNEGTPTAALSFTVGDLETPAGSLVVTGSSSNPALVPVAGLNILGAGANRTVTVTPAATGLGVSTIQLTVTDGFGSAVSTSFLLTVTRVSKDSLPITDIGAPGLGGLNSEALAVNASGQIVGYAETTIGSAGPPAVPARYHAFSWASGVLIDLGTLGGSNSVATAVSATGHVVGSANTAGDASTLAFSWTTGPTPSGTMLALGTLGGTNSSAVAVNAAGQVVGSANTLGDTSTHAFKWTTGPLVDLGTLGGTNSFAAAVNASGEVVGNAQTLGDVASHAFVWTTGPLFDLGTFGGTNSAAVAVNDSGQVVGFSQLIGDAFTHAFSWTAAGGVVDLGTLPGFLSSKATAVGADGRVVGYAYDTSVITDHTIRAFSWTAADGMVDLGTLGGGSSAAAAVNPAGQVIGRSLLGDGNEHAFRWLPLADSPEGMVDLGTLGGSTSRANDVNGSGRVVGRAAIAGDGAVHAVKWETNQSQTITFDPLSSRTFGDVDFAVSATATSGLAVTFAASGNCTVSGATVHLTGAGSCTITASQPGNSEYNAAPDVARGFAIAKASQTITFAPLGGKTLGDADFSVSATASSGLSVSFAAAGNCVFSGGNVHLTGAGSCTVTASQSGDGNYDPAPDVPRTFAIAKASQAITFAALVNRTWGDPPFGVSATASSGLLVSFNASGNCTVDVAGTAVHLTGAGSCTITASQPGDGNYNAAASVARTFSIARADQTIAFGALGGATWGDPDFGVSAVTSSGLAVTFTASGNCTVDAAGTTVHLTSAGSCTITASQAGDSNYNPAPDVARTFAIAKANQTITFGALGSKLVGDPDFAVSATASSGLVVNFNASGVCIVVLATVHLTGLPGSCTITASQPGDSNYNPAADVPRTFAIGKVPQTITFTTNAPASATYTTTFTVAATGGASGNAVTFTSAGVCTNVGAIYTMTSGTGTCSVIADQAGNATYQAAPQVVELVAATKASQTINFNPAVTSYPPQTTTFAVSATASSGLPPTFDSTTPLICTVSGSTVTLVHPPPPAMPMRTCIIEATQAGDANYAPATTVPVSFTIGGPATPPIKVKFPVGPDSDGTVGTPYDAWFTATGGAGGYTFSITAGSLPAGLSLNAATGEITGTPTTAVDRPAAKLTVTVVDVYGNSDSATGSITIHPLPPP